MSFELWIIISVLAGVLIGMLVFLISERLGARRFSSDNNVDVKRLAITEGLLWLSPVINHLQKCILLVSDFQNGIISANQLKQSWPNIDLNAKKTHPGRSVVSYLSKETYQKGMDAIAKLEYLRPVLPEAILSKDADAALSTEMILSELKSNLQQFESLDAELRIMIQ